MSFQSFRVYFSSVEHKIRFFFTYIYINGNQNCLVLKYGLVCKISSMFHRRKYVMLVWNDMKVSE